MLDFIYLVVGMIFILLAAMVFCNALEHLGEKMGISEGVTGSIFVAVGTALPEALMPLIAFFSSNPDTLHMGNEIGVGAILGPPLMLSTLSLALMAFSILKKRGLHGNIRPEKTGLRRDLKFFGFGYLLAVLLAISHNFVQSTSFDIMVVAILFGSYFFYVLLTIRASSKLVSQGHATEAHEELYLNRWLKLPDNTITIICQAVIGFIGLLFFAHLFIEGISGVSKLIGISPFLLSVVLVPIATELPEKVNSILWVRKGKDTLAFSNITGAMVFQGLLLPAMGIIMTNWTMSLEKMGSIVATFIALAWLLYASRGAHHFKVWHFMINLGLYVFSLIFSLGVY